MDRTRTGKEAAGGRRNAAGRLAHRRRTAHRRAARRGVGRAGPQWQAARPAADRVGHDLRGRARPHPRPPGRPRVRRPQRPRRRRRRSRRSSPSRWPAATRRSRSAGRTAGSSSRWPTRRTCSRSTTSARSRAPRCAPSSRPRRRSTRPSSASTGWTPTSTRSCRPRPRTPTTRPTSRNVSELVEDAPIVKFVNLLVTQAVDDRASDIHVEPAEHDLRIRFRIDGVLHEVMRSPRSIQAGVISRLKVMADINIAERRIPQDGRISMKVGGRGIDLRVATLPTVYGEKVVMRILDKGQAVLRLDGPRLPARDRERVSRASYRKPYGTILVTGPTGSGKSTTLYATLNTLNTARPQHHHGRGPGRVPAAGHQPGADQPEGRADVRVGAAVDPAFRPRHRARR